MVENGQKILTGQTTPPQISSLQTNKHRAWGGGRRIWTSHQKTKLQNFLQQDTRVSRRSKHLWSWMVSTVAPSSAALRRRTPQFPTRAPSELRSIRSLSQGARAEQTGNPTPHPQLHQSFLSFVLLMGLFGSLLENELHFENIEYQFSPASSSVNTYKSGWEVTLIESAGYTQFIPVPINALILCHLNFFFCSEFPRVPASARGWAPNNSSSRPNM